MRRILSVRRRAVLTAALVPALMATMFGFGAGVAQAATTTFFSIQTSAVRAKSGLPYKMTMFVNETQGQPTDGLFLSFTRKVSTTTASLTQTHSYSFSIPETDVTIDPNDLVPTKIDTGTDLGKFGNITMTLRNASPLSTKKFRCPNGTLTDTISKRTGKLKGTFHFVANDNYFKTINKSALPATVTKDVNTGKSCGGGGGGCSTGYGFSAFDSNPGGLSLFASKPLKDGHANIFMSRSVQDAPASIGHSIFGTVPASSFAISSTSAVAIKGGALAPMAKNTIHFSKKSSSTTGTHCKTTTTQEKFASGNILAKFDSGGRKRMDSSSNFAFPPSLSKTFKT
jgi:hypothetical protein